MRSEVQVLPGPPRIALRRMETFGERHESLRGHSSAGRAPALQAGGRRFDPVWLHQDFWLGKTGRHIILGRNKFADCSLVKSKSACSIEIVKRRYIRTIAPMLLRKLSACRAVFEIT